MFSIRAYVLLATFAVSTVVTTTQEMKQKGGDKERFDAIVSRMPESTRQKYERLRRADFARLALEPRLLESGEAPEKLAEPYKVGGKIYFRLLITNTSTQTVAISLVDTYKYNRPQLLRDNEPVQYRKGIVELLKAKDDEVMPRSLRAVTLVQGETATDYINLDDWYDSLPSGHYQISLRRRFVWAGEWVESPSLIFEVTLKKSKTKTGQ